MNDHDLPRRPALRPYLRQVGVDDGVTFRGGATDVTLRGHSVQDLLPDLLPLLDGARTVDELGRELPHVDADVLRGALHVLQEQHLLGEADGSLDGASSTGGTETGQDLYWQSLPNGEQVRSHFAETKALIGGSGQLATALQDVLARSRVAVTPDVEAARFADEGADDAVVGVWCSDSPQAEELRAVNLAAVRSGMPWLAVTLGADHATVGPFVLPGQSACHECFRLRLRSNGSMLDDALGTLVARAQPAPPPALPAYFVTLVAATAAAEVVRWLSGLARPSSVGAFLSLTPADALAVRHEVLKLPRCAVCGPIRYRPQMKIWDLTRDEDAARAEQP